MAQLSKNGAVWQSNRAEPDNSFENQDPGKNVQAKPLPREIHRAMKARLAESPPRAMIGFMKSNSTAFAHWLSKMAKMFACFRGMKRISAKNFLKSLKRFLRLKADDAIIDGEIVALDAKGVHRFNYCKPLNSAKSARRSTFTPLICCGLNGKDLRGTNPGRTQSTSLKNFSKRNLRLVRYSASLGEDGKKLLEARAKAWAWKGLSESERFHVYEAGRAQRRLDQTQAASGAGICHRRLHQSRRQPATFWRIARSDFTKIRN